MAGSPRSGTTLLRDLLRTSPQLAAPEETHFYRWSSPYKSATYTSRCKGRVLERHRKIDGVSEDEFWTLYETCSSRRELQDRYVALFLERRGLTGRQWFDKTPQNAYGLNLLLPDYPDSTILHIARHPVAVVASLIRGDVLKADSLDEAIEHWREPTRALVYLERLQPARVLTCRYVDLLTSIESTIGTIGDRLGFAPFSFDAGALELRSTPRPWDDVLTEEDARTIRDRCAPEIAAFGLDDCV